jgi:DUF917 family protein
MNEKIELTKQDMMNICRGAGFFASGGGGSVEQTHDMIENIWKIADKKPVFLISPASVPENALLASVAMIGSPDALKKLPNQCKYASINSLKLLSEKTNSKIEYLVSVETGSVNITIPMIVAAITGMPYVDCTGTSRSVPKLQNTTYAVGGVDSSPAAFANDNEKSTTQYLISDGVVKVDDLARNVIENENFNQVAGFSNFLMTGKQMRETGSLGCVTMAKGLGEVLYKAKSEHANPFSAIENYLRKLNRKTFLLGIGKVMDMKTVNSGGFDALNVIIQTTDNDIITIVALNENLLAWSAKKTSPIAMAPDLISYVSADYQTHSNADIKVGDEIILVGSQSSTDMRNPKLIASFMEELKTMGYYGPYIPIEELYHKNINLKI